MDAIGGTVVGRTGDTGADYWSMPVGMLQQAIDHGSDFAKMAMTYLKEADCGNVDVSME